MFGVVVGAEVYVAVIVCVPAFTGFELYVNATFKATAVVIVNVLFVGALEVLPAISVVDESETVAVPSLYVVPLAALTV